MNRHKKDNKKIDRQTDRHTERQTGRQTDRQTDRQTGRQAGRQAGRKKEKKTGRQPRATSCMFPLLKLDLDIFNYVCIRLSLLLHFVTTDSNNLMLQTDSLSGLLPKLSIC